VVRKKSSCLIVHFPLIAREKWGGGDFFELGLHFSRNEASLTGEPTGLAEVRNMRARLPQTDSERLGLACRVAVAGDELAAWGEVACAIPDWDALLAAARRERVAPLLAHALERGQIPPAGPPANVQAALRREYLATAAKAAILGDAAAGLLSAFARVGIPLIALKGLALAETIYPNPALRPMEDLDFLIRSSDLPAAVRLLAETGYREAWHGFPDFQRADGLVDVDLHTELLHEGEVPTRLDAQAIGAEALFAAAQPATIAGQPGLVLSAAHQLLHLCQHLCYHHGLSGLLRHADILALTTRHPDLLTSGCLGPLAVTRAGRRALYHALASCEHRLGWVLPAGVLDTLHPSDQSWLEKRLEAQRRTETIPSAARYYLLLRSLPNRRQRIRFLMELAGAWWRLRRASSGP
jgi:hypothetical protein